jgi:translocation and assembly module TamB
LNRRRWLAAFVLIPLVSVAAFGAWVLATESGGRWLMQRAVGQLPGAALGHASGTLLSRLRLDAFRYRAADGTVLEIETVTLQWRPQSLLHAELRISALELQGIQLQLAESGAAAEPLAMPVFSTPVAVRIDRLALLRAELHRGSDSWSLEALRSTVQLVGDSVKLTNLQLAGEGLQLSGDGRFSGVAPHALAANLDWTLQREELPALTGHLTASGDLQALVIEQRISGSGAVQASLQGKLWPDFVDHRHRFDVQADWSGLMLPLAGADLLSEQGQFSISGQVSDYRLVLKTRLQHPQAGLVMASMNGQGDAAGLRIANGSLRGWDGELELNGRVGWSPEVNWELQLSGRDINPGIPWPQWQGRLDLEAAVTGALDDAGLSLTLAVKRLGGDLRDYPVSASGALSSQNGRWRVDKVDLRSGDNHVSVHGDVMPRLDLGAELDAPHLAALLPGASGSLQGTAQLRGVPEQLSVRLDLRGRAVTLGELTAAELMLAAEVDPGDVQASHWQLAGSDLRYGDQQADVLQIQGTGNASEHRLSGLLRSDQGQVDLAASGSYRDEAWRGQLGALTLTSSGVGRWSLQAPVALRADRRQYRVERLCLAQGDARLCARGTGATDGDLDVEAQWQDLPLQLLQPLLAEDATVTGTVDGSALMRRAKQQLAADAKVRMSSGSVRFLPDTGPEVIAEHRDGRAELSYRDGRLQIEGSVSIGDTGRIQGQATIGPESAGRPLSGGLELLLPDTAPLAALVPGVSNLSGPLQLRGEWRGKMEQPRVRLDGSWSDGRARMPELGIELTDIDLLLRGDDDRLAFTGSASSGPGQVQLQGEIWLDPASGWPVTVSVNGENFEVARRADVEGRVSPALRFEARDGAISASGKLVVPYARVTAEKLERGAVRSSADEVIVGSSQPTVAKAQSAGPMVKADVVLVLGDEVHLDAYGLTTRITGDLRLLQASGAAAEGLGQLLLEDGRYKAYGQDLTIERGRLLFSGPLQNPGVDVRAVRKSGNVTAGILLSGSLREPEIALFSEPVMEQADVLSYLMTGGPRSAAGGSMNSAMLAQAALGLGLDKSGVLTSQLGESMGLDEFRVEAGAEGVEGSVMAVGKQLSPDLYLRYLYGLFDSSASVQIRYLMTERLRLEGQTGEHHSVDLIYEMERD